MGGWIGRAGVIAALAAAAASLGGCQDPPTRDDLVGVYRYERGDMLAELDLRADGTYHLVAIENGETVFSQSDTWGVEDDAKGFPWAWPYRQIWFRNGKFRYDEPGYGAADAAAVDPDGSPGFRLMSAELGFPWGGFVLSLDPDLREEFVRLR